MAESNSNLSSSSSPSPSLPQLPQQFDSLPPMLRQYCEYKVQHPECLLLFQVGDFYEVFFEDAVVIARSLNLTLTSRDKNSDEPIPMCGVPISVVDGYLDRLVDLGFSVALVSQTVPASQVTKGMVPRALERIVTPGVRLLGGAQSRASRDGVAAVVFETETEGAIAFSDVQSGVVWIRDGVSSEEVAAELARMMPAEVVLCDRGGDKSIDARTGWVRAIERIVGVPLRWRGVSCLEGGRFEGLSGAAVMSPRARRSCWLLLHWLEETTLSVAQAITEVRPLNYLETMAIDPSTRSSLELVASAKDGSSRATLLSYLDETSCGAGWRLLRSWIVNPTTKIAELNERYDAVAAWINQGEGAQQVQAVLRRAIDVERLATRLSVEVATPRELGALRDLLTELPPILTRLSELSEQPERLQQLFERAVLPESFRTILDQFLVDSPPNQIAEGGIIRAGVNSELDRLRELRDNGKSRIALFEREERERTGSLSLKIKYNNVLGYFIELPTARAQSVPAEYVRRQSVAQAERFIVPILKELEEEILGASGKINDLEERLFRDFRSQLVGWTGELRRVSRAIAEIDLLIALSIVARKHRLVRPELVAEPILRIDRGKHPVVAELLGSSYVTNSLHFDQSERRCAVITGPNMGGKSTFLRQVALTVVMAQIGSFVPADRAVVGIVDKIFARVGASDDLFAGESTFMVEMREAAAIVQGATPSSLILIDEIGRGTSTSDGEALAQAILEWVCHTCRSRTLFATHFHPLTAVAESNPAMINLSVGAVERGDAVFFTHEIVSGPAGRSYGLQVAQRAGLPPTLVARAQEILNSQMGAECKESVVSKQLVSKQVVSKKKKIDDRQPTFFDFVAATSAVSAHLHELRDRVAALVPDAMTPREALEHLYELRKLVSRDDNTKVSSVPAQTMMFRDKIEDGQ
jgi:DNA mismatch repair protein MutS